MNRWKVLPFTLLLAALALASCSGPKVPCTTNCVQQGTATVSATLAAVPLTPPPGANILSFMVTITAISLTPSSGGTAVSLTLPATSITVDLVKLQSDSAFVGQIVGKVPAATYNKISVSVSGVVVTYCTQTSPGTAGCSVGSIAQVTQAAVVPATSSFSMTLSNNQQAGVQIQFNLANSLTLSATQPQVVSAVDITASNALTASVLAPTSTTSSLASGQLDFVEDVTGLVTAATSTSVTIQTMTRGSITANSTSSTFFSPNCTGFSLPTTMACANVNQIASIDAALNADGTFTLLDYDPLDTTATDWIEGVVTLVPTSLTQFQIVANDLFQPTSGSLIGTKLALGSTVTINLGTGVTFGVDTRGLIVPADATTFEGSNDTTVLRPGQTVAVRVSSFTAAVGSTPASATVSFVGLRFTRVTGNVSSVAAPTSISIQSLPPFFGQTTTQVAELNTAAAPSTAPTNYDGVSDGTGLTVGNTVSIRALYFGTTSAMPFTCAKVRKH
jgi:uncharacterized protein DUF4382